MDNFQAGQTLTLNDPVVKLKGVGPRIGERLQHLGIRKVQDLLFHLPYRYIDRTRLVPIGSLRSGDTALCQGTIELIQAPAGRRRSLLCRIGDGTGAITLRFFHFTRAQQAGLKQGTRLRCWGQIRRVNHALEMVHPEYQRVGRARRRRPGADADAGVPVDPGEFPSSNCATWPGRPWQRHVRGWRRPGRIAAGADFAGVLRFQPGPGITVSCTGRRAMRTWTAWRTAAHPAQQRLVFEELLAHHLSLRLVRKTVRAQPSFVISSKADGRIRAFLDNLPFELTGAQKRVLARNPQGHAETNADAAPGPG